MHQQFIWGKDAFCLKSSVFFYQGSTVKIWIRWLHTGTLSGVVFAVGCILGGWIMLGMCNAAFSAIILHAIGEGLASTKYALLSSFGNIPLVGMTAFVGWLHDSQGVRMMLLSETFIGIGFIVVSVLALCILRLRKIIATD